MNLRLNRDRTAAVTIAVQCSQYYSEHKGRLEATDRRGEVVQWRRGDTELVEKSLEAEAAALAFRRPRDTQPRHIS